MKFDPVLLNMACSWSIKAYNDENRDATKIESALTSTTAYVVKRKTIDIIVFRGTQQVKDWAFNLFPVPVPYAGRLCHAGFVAAHASVWDDIEPYIDHNKRTLICGHSLGGALAELTAAKLNGKHDNLNLITFGKPNTFFKGFKKPFTLDNQISVVNGSDLVARVPRLCYGPSKSQDMLYFANSGANYINPSSYMRKLDRNVKDRIADHFMGGYKERLIKFLEDQKNGKTDTDI
jgi:pimeloyl-ACP methyl ester carboxylesterase